MEKHIEKRTESNGLGILKTAIIMLLIAMQVALFVLLRLYLVNVFGILGVLSVVFTLATCFYVLSSDYNGQAKATWIFFLLLTFSFGYLIFWISNKKFMFRKNSKKYNQIMKKTEEWGEHADLSKLDNKSMRSACEYLYNVGKFEASLCSKTEYFATGEELFADILKEIKKAEKFIFVEYYIISKGRLYNEFFDILIEKASAGVDVRVIYDDIGCNGTFNKKECKFLERAGVKLYAFNRLIPAFNIALNYRDHRKIVIVDGKVAFTGGANLADEYINQRLKFGYWKDTGIKIMGPAVDNFTVTILNQWEFLTEKQEVYENYLGKADKFEGEGAVVPYVSGPNYPVSIAQNTYLNVISNAKEKLYIMTPYLIVDETITNMLINRIDAGVDVRIVLPSIPDKKIVYILTLNNAEKLFLRGAKIYLMDNGFAHGKMMLTENSVVVGSINMDLRSFNQQFESAVLTNEASTMQAVEKDFEEIMDKGQKFSKENLKRNKITFRMKAGLINLFSQFM